MILRIVNGINYLLKETYYHFFEVKIDKSSLAYKKWAFTRLLKIISRKTSDLEGFLLPVDTYITNRYGKFFIPKMSDYIITVSPVAEANLLKYFTLPEHGTFLDIGANAGKYSIIIAQKYPKVKVFSFEPAPKTYSVLVENIKINRLEERAKSYNIGLSDNEGTIQFATSSTYTGVSHIIDTSTGQYDRFDYNHVNISINKLDNIIATEKIDVDTIFLVKIDVEGHEINALKGSINTLNSMPKSAKVIIEVHPDEERISKVYEILNKCGFSGIQIDKENYIFTKN
ncbi:FkbM family methyltransferase [Spirosoma panaciterrae]|uniref:FkbM family methyltransferase n=1 Tax=Spirosoma panaciterrae TaxID=496058 RepID=UPI0003714FEE|nr:FkbM family methyltransferase [Spirosoma panaciterrae]